MLPCKFGYTDTLLVRAPLFSYRKHSQGLLAFVLNEYASSSTSRMDARIMPLID